MHERLTWVGVAQEQVQSWQVSASALGEMLHSNYHLTGDKSAGGNQIVLNATHRLLRPKYLLAYT